MGGIVMMIEICSDTKNQIVTDTLIESYKDYLSDLKTVKKTKKPLGITSWHDYKKEKRHLKKRLNTLDDVITYFTGSDWKEHYKV